MKKWSCLVLCLVIWGCAAGDLFAQESTLRVLNSSGNPGSEANPVFVELSNTSSVGVVQFVLSFDWNILTLNDVQPTGRTEGMGTFSWVVLDSGTVVMLIQDLPEGIIAPGVGPVATFFFDVAEDQLGGETLLHLSDARLFDPFANALAIRTADGMFRLTVPDISLSALSHTYSYVLLGSSEVWDFVISNPGSGTLTVSSISSDNFEFAITSPSFPQDIPPAGSVVVTIVFSPAINGPRTASVAVITNDPDEQQLHLSLKGGGTSVDIEVPATEHHFDEVNIGSYADWPLIILNNGVGNLTVSAIGSSHPDFSIPSPTFPQTISPAGSLEVTVRYRPSAQGPLTATLTIASNDPDENSIPITVTGAGVAAIIQLSALSHNYGEIEVGTSEGWLLSVFNTGTSDLTVNSVSSDNPEFSVSFPAFPRTISPGGVLEMIVSFLPTTVGDRDGQLSIMSNDPFTAATSVSLTGIGVPSATLRLGEGSGAPGSRDNAVPIILTNRRNVTALRCIIDYNPERLDLSRIVLTERANRMGIFSVTEPVAGRIFLIIEDLAERAITVGSGPVAQMFFHVDSDAPPLEEPLTLSNVVLNDSEGESIFTLFDEPGLFTITAPEMVLSVSSYDFGPILLGHTQTWMLQISNQGTTDLSIVGLTSSHSDFEVFLPSLPQTIAVGGTLGVVIQFTPTSLGRISGAVTVVSDDPDEALVSLPITGTGVTPRIQLASASHDFGNVVLNTSASWPLVVHNVGTAGLVITHSAADKPDFFVSSPQFPQTVAPSDSLTVLVTYLPSSLGSQDGILQLFSNDPENEEMSISLEGVGTSPHISASDTGYDFGEVVVGGVQTWLLRLHNIGTADLVIQTITSDRRDFSVITPSFPQTVPPNGYIEVHVSFSPRTEGPISGQLTVVNNDPLDGAYHISVEGQGIGSDIDFQPLSHDFGPVLLNSSRAWTFTIFNMGIVLLEVEEITTKTTDVVVSSPFFPQSVVPGDSFDVTVLFRPSVLGVIHDTLRIVSNDPDEPVLTLPVRGSGVAPHMVLSSENFDFGDVVIGRYEQQSLTIENAGAYDLHISHLTMNDSTEFTMNTVLLPHTIPPSGSLIVSFTFKPSQPGSKTDVLVLESSDLDQPTVSVSLSGQGIAPPEVACYDRTSYPGATDLLIPLNLENDMVVTKAVFTLQYDPARLTIVSVKPTIRTEHMATFSWSQPGQGQISLTIDDAQEKAIAAGSGWIAEIHCNVKSNAPLGTSQVTLPSAALYDAENVALPLKVWGGSVEVVSSTEKVTIVVPHRTRPAGDTFTVPVQIQNSITGLGVYSLEFSLLFDPRVLTATGASDRGTLADYWRSKQGADYQFASGVLEDRVVVVIASGAYALDSMGTFANVTFRVNADAQTGAVSPFHFEDFFVNEGRPPSEFIDGWFSVAAVPDIDFTLRTYDFDSVAVGGSRTWQLSIFNVGDQNLVVDSVVSSEPQFQLESLSLPKTVVPDGSFQVNVNYRPIRLGETLGTIRVRSNDYDEPKAVISLRGVGTSTVDVELADFHGLWTGEDVILQWKTNRTDDILGFHVYRKGEHDSDFARLTTSHIVDADDRGFLDAYLPGTGSYSYRLTAVQTDGSEQCLGELLVKVTDGLFPSSVLHQNYPNPFNPQTQITFVLSRPGAVSLSVFNTLGQMIRNLVNGDMSSGYHAVMWDGTDDRGELMPSGVYYYRLDAVDLYQTRSMLLLR